MARPVRRVPATLLLVVTLAAGGAVVLPAAVAGAVAPSVTVPLSLTTLAGQAGPVGDVAVTESTPGQLQLGDVFTYRFEDTSSAATLHFSAAGTVSGTNGLTATVALASSNTVGPPLDDEMKVTITATSAASTFAGVLTLSGLTAAVDSGAGIGNDKVLVSDASATLGGTDTVSDAAVVSSGTLHAPYAPQSTPTILPTANGQLIGSVAITEPSKSYLHANDVITFELRDANGSADTVGLAAAPFAAGGSMTVDVTGANGPTVAANDTAFDVDVVAGDPSSGSASTIMVTNLTVNTAKAPLGSVTLTAQVTAGPDVGSALIVPGRVTIATVGGTTTTTAVGVPTVTKSSTGQFGGDLRVAMTSGSVVHDDTVSATIQSGGVTFTNAAPPIATVTSGSLVLASAEATLSNGGTTATWTVTTGAITASTMELAPIEYDLTGAPAAGSGIQVQVAGEQGSDFTTQVVSDATVASPSAPGSFATVAASIPTASAPPFAGAPITFTETSAGALTSGEGLVLLSPDATQIAAYRTTFSKVPTALETGGLVLGAATVNTSTLVVATTSGTVTAPPQTAAIFPVTTPSASASTVTFSNLAYGVGTLVAPGAMVVTGVVEHAGGLTTAVGGNQVVDEVDDLGLGTTSGTTPPVASFSQTPHLASSSTSATFAFQSDQVGSTFACSLDGVVVSLNCPTPITLPGLGQGHHSFTVQAFNLADIASAPVAYGWTVDVTPPTVHLVVPATLSSPISASFSEPVIDLTALTARLTSVPASGPAITVPAMLTCTTASKVTQPCAPLSRYVALAVRPLSHLVPGQHYVLALNPLGAAPAIQDVAGNPLPTQQLGFRGVLVQDQASPAAAATWSTAASAAASGGSYAVADLAGSSASFTFTGTSVTWLGATGPWGGDATVAVDGHGQPSIDTYAAAPHFKVAHTIGGLANGTHTLVITARGVRGGARATGSDVVVDAFTPGGQATVQQSSPAVAYTWGRVGAPRASAHAYAAAELKGATLTFTFRGTAVSWVTVLGSAMGQANVLVDGHPKGTVDGYARATRFGVSHAVGGLTDTVHTLTIVVLGRHARASGGAAVAVDGFRVT
jgi:hypothetical protein